MLEKWRQNGAHVNHKLGMWYAWLWDAFTSGL